MRRDLSSKWSSRVHATDASLWGRGVVASERRIEEVRQLGRRNDRWRLSSVEEHLILDEEFKKFPDKVEVNTLRVEDDGKLDEVGLADSVEVPLDFIGTDWSKIDGARWDRVESIPILEGRSVVWLFQHLARSQKNLGRKHLVLTDSMSVTLFLTKGRSSTKSMNRICRQVAALQFATGMMLHLRWIPSELNPADLPSRARSTTFF